MASERTILSKYALTSYPGILLQVQVCDISRQIYTDIFNEIESLQDEDINFYDIRKQCEGSLCYDFPNMESFLDSDDVKEALGVGDIEFVSWSSVVYSAMANDWMQNLEEGIPALLKAEVNVLIYVGEYDLICNWLGNSRWVHAMEWSGHKDFVGAATVPFNVDGKEAGVLKNHGLKVHDAGHMVPMDKPKAQPDHSRKSLIDHPILKIGQSQCLSAICCSYTFIVGIGYVLSDPGSFKGGSATSI